MFATLSHLVMTPFMFVWLYTSQHSWRGLPVPESGTRVGVDGPHPSDHILLCGSGIVVGYGVSSHELALGGSLARSIVAITKRGAEITTVTSPRLSEREAQLQLSGSALKGMDAVVLSFGTFDLLTLLPAPIWGRRMRELVNSVLVNEQSNAYVFLLECTAPKMSGFTGAYRRRLVRLTSEYNDEIRSIAKISSRIHHIEFAPEPEDPEAILGRRSYRDWADLIAPRIARELSRPSDA